MVLEDPQVPQRYRDRHRAARRREFLDVARRIVTSEGQRALTMQRVTDEVGSSTGGIYLYFPSKQALVAALQREAVDVVLASYLQGQAALDAALAKRGAAREDAALARVLATGRFWIDSEETLPAEIELCRRLIAGADAAPDEAIGEVFPVALRLLAEIRDRVAGATEAGALSPGDPMERAVMLIGAVTGVLLSSKLGVWDPGLFAGRRLAGQVSSDLLGGWGAPSHRLEAAAALVTSFGRRHAVAPPVDPADPAVAGS